MSIKVLCNLCGSDHYTVVYDTLLKGRRIPAILIKLQTILLMGSEDR